ncbi:hypothetical protein EVAR_76277_1 [Eumeta japonica]|uniref:Uncharacterized protein n=1 Tax=Eumeta variegata TaxID=151549 RepID=A0A4C1UQD2_EUMVA|nr:hypothetical protein EVAR_76277_1 [Eumeta japonica]
MSHSLTVHNDKTTSKAVGTKTPLLSSTSLQSNRFRDRTDIPSITVQTPGKAADCVSQSLNDPMPELAGVTYGADAFPENDSFGRPQVIRLTYEANGDNPSKTTCMRNSGM